MPQSGSNDDCDTAVKFVCYGKMTCLVIRPLIHFIIILIVLVAFTSTEMPQKDSHAVSSWVQNTTDFTVFEVHRTGKGSDRGNNPDRGNPRFLSVEQMVRVEHGETAYLTCRVINLDNHHTVSWVRSDNVVVLTVGGLVFSSDPRVGVVHLPRPWQHMAVWALRISQVTHTDSGQYQCQVNTEPPITIDITLRVGSEIDESIEDAFDGSKNVTKDNYEEEVRSVNIVKVSRKSKENSEAGFTFSKVPLYKDRKVGDEAKTIEGALSNTLVASEKANDFIDTDQKVSDEKSDIEGRSLLLPICLLFAVTSIILILGSIRTFVIKRHQSDQNQNGKIRIRSNSIESRKSGSSRKSDSSRKSNSSRKSKSSHNPSGESMYEEVDSARMSPVIEVIEATPPTTKTYTPAHEAKEGSEETSLCSGQSSLSQGFGERYPGFMATVDSLDGSVANTRHLAVRKGHGRSQATQKKRIHFNPFDEYSD